MTAHELTAGGHLRVPSRTFVTTAAIAGGSALAAGIHLAVIAPHLRGAVVHGVFFAAIAVAQAWIAVSWLAAPSRRRALGAATINGVTIALWVAAVTVGVPFAGPVTPEPVTIAGAVATAVEAAVVAGSLVALTQPIAAAGRGSRRLGYATGAAVLVAGAALGVATPTHVHGAGEAVAAPEASAHDHAPDTQPHGH